MSGTECGEKEIERAWLTQTRELLGSLPQEYAESHAALVEISAAFRRELAAALQDKLNAHVKRLPHDTYAERQLIASFVNLELRELGLAIQCPRTSRPAILVADYRGKDDLSSRFRFQVRDEKGKPSRSHVSLDVPDLRLMEDQPRKEGRARAWNNLEDFRRK